METKVLKAMTLMTTASLMKGNTLLEAIIQMGGKALIGTLGISIHPEKEKRLILGMVNVMFTLSSPLPFIIFSTFGSS
ncbi:hypothetical protein ACT8ZR_15070 [Neobacillus sp. M.A.Huq-85]